MEEAEKAIENLVVAKVERIFPQTFGAISNDVFSMFLQTLDT